MSTDRNEALRLADDLDDDFAHGRISNHCGRKAAALLRQQAEQVAELEAEVQEQARCNGMGAERELALMAERDQLRAEVERLRAAMTVPTIEPNSQNWQGMDGAIAFHLIERHADSWADAGRMMREWLEANAIDHARTTHKETE